MQFRLQPVPVAPDATAPALTSAASYGPVRPGESLRSIAAAIRAATGLGLDEIVLALYRANPDAFVGGDSERLRPGVVLRVPPLVAAASAPLP
jgi:pilus assembly protein FimV